MNFTENYLGVLKKLGKIDDFCDQDGITIQTISFGKPEGWNRSKPKIIYDKFTKDESLAKPILKEVRYLTLEREGMDIISVPIKKKKRWFKGQYVSYKLAWKTKEKGHEKIPEKHKLIYDSANNRFKLKGVRCRDSYGRIGESDWFPPTMTNSRKRKLDIALPSSQKIMLDKKKRYELQKIDDIPVMIGLNGEIICVPHRKEPNNIAIVGKKGTGKTLLTHRLVDEIFWMLGEKVVIMNDIQEECIPWNKKQDDKNWINQLEVINELPLPLPVIYVYPHTYDLELDYVKLKGKISFVQITIPFKEVIDNANVYLKLKDSIRYILDLKKDLEKCERTSDIINLIEGKYDSAQMKTMVNKMVVSFNNIFHEEILNITNKEYPYQIENNGELENPFVIIAKNGVVPCFETANLFSKRYMPEVFSYHLDCLFNSKLRNESLYGEVVYIVFDEISQICDDDNKNSTHTSLCKIATMGRRRGIGIIYATQNYSKIPRKIKSNTDFVFAFQHSNEEEVKKIKGDFNLTELDWKDIANLEDFELMGITNEYFVCYKNGKKWIERNPVRGNLIPPMSRHLKPK